MKLIKIANVCLKGYLGVLTLLWFLRRRDADTLLTGPSRGPQGLLPVTCNLRTLYLQCDIIVAL